MKSAACCRSVIFRVLPCSAHPPKEWKFPTICFGPSAGHILVIANAIDRVGERMTFQIKRVYDPAEPGDGIRVLVDRLWPRGIKKTDARLDHWLKDVAPSSELRLWFGHKPERFEQFSEQYRSELSGNPAVEELSKLGKGKTVTLLYGARDPQINHALVLQSVLQHRPKRAAK
jgi:uncharacterized protein YeaO (DUF488 family)